MDDLNDWGWEAMANGFCPTIDASSSSFAVTTTALVPATPTIPANNNQMMDGVNDWGLHAVVNDFSPNTVASSSSLAPVTTTFNPPITTTQTIPMNNNQMVSGVADWGLHQTVDDLYPSFDSSSSSFSFSYSSSTFSANTAMTTTMPMTNTTTTTIPMTNTPLSIPVGNYNQQNASFSGEMLTQHHPMNIKNIKQMLQNSNYPINIPNIQNPPISNNNMSILALPSPGKMPKASKYHHYQQQQQHQPLPLPQQNHQPLPQQNHLQINQPPIRVSEHTNALPHVTTRQSKIKTKRVYKMPVQGLNTDKLSWKKYGAKLLDGSPYPRVYYKCTVTNDCKVRRKVQLNKSDPNTLIITYSGDHNHTPPSSMNFFAGSSSNIDFTNGQVSHNNVETNHPTFSKAISPAAVLSFGKKKTQKNKNVNVNVNVNKEDDVFGGLEDFIPL